MITLRDILNRVATYLPSLLKCQGSSQFVSVKLLTSYQSSFYEDTLYIGYVSHVRSLKHIPDRTTLFVIKDQEADYLHIVEKQITLCEFSNTVDLCLLFNCVSEVFNEKNELLNGASLLFRSLIQNNNLEQIVNIAAKLINNPLIVIDSSYNILATSTTIPVEDYQWKENIARGYLTYEYIAALNNLEGIRNEPNDNRPFITLCVMSPIRRKFSKLIIDGLFLGYYIAIESNVPFDTIDDELYLLVSNVLAKEVSVERNITRLNKNQTYEGLLVDLLDANFSNRITFCEGIKGAVFDKAVPFKLIAVDLSTYTNFNSLEENFKKSIDRSLPEAWSVYYKKHIVILTEMGAKGKKSRNDFSKFEKFLEENNLRGAMSDQFTDLYLLPKYYKQAISALKFSSVLNQPVRLVEYDYFKFYDLIQGFEDISGLLDYCCKIIRDIKNYDALHGTEYFETLFKYLDCNKSLSETAKALFVHKNTVSYRITKIKELFELDFNDFYTSFQLYYSCLIVNYLRMLPA